MLNKIPVAALGTLRFQLVQSSAVVDGMEKTGPVLVDAKVQVFPEMEVVPVAHHPPK